MQHLQFVKMLEYDALFTFDNFFHNTPIIFVTLLEISSRLLESFLQNSSDAFIGPYISLLSSVYINFFADIYIDEWVVVGWVYLLK